MRFFSQEREFGVDLKTLSLNDLLDKMKEENYFNSEKEFYFIELLGENEILFGVPRDRANPKQIHRFKYLKDKKKIQIKSKYKHYFFPSFLLYAMPILLTALEWNELRTEVLNTIAFMFVGMTLFILISAFLSLKESSKHIERELMIRVNYLLRKQGYRVGI